MTKELKNEILSEDVQTQKQLRIESIFGVFSNVTATIPTKVPRNFSQSIKIYSSGATYRLYIYDTVSASWRYATLT